MKKEKAEIDKLIKKANNIALTSHLSADLDALGSILGVWFYLKNNFPQKEIKMVMEGQPPQQGNFLPGFEEILWTHNLASELLKSDLIFFLDASLLSRFTCQSQDLDLRSKTTLCFDHHPETRPDSFSFRIADTSAAATAQLVTEIFFTDDLINREVAEVLLAGILGDTGNLRFIGPDKTRVLLAVEKLARLGKIDLQVLILRLNRLKDETWELIKILAKNSQRLLTGISAPVAYSWLPFSVLGKYDLSTIKEAYHFFQDTFLRLAANTTWTFVVAPESLENYSLSFRAVPGGPNVQVLARFFNGGGHFLASGGEHPVKENGRLILAKEVCQKVLAVFQKEKIPLVSE